MRRFWAGIGVCGFMIFFFSLCVAETPETLNEALRPLGLQMAGPFKLESHFQRSSGDKVYRTLVVSDGALYVEIELHGPISRQRADNYAKSKYAVLHSLYDAHRSPYPGQITNEEECPPDRKPESRTNMILGRPVEVLVANGTERHTFGVWQDDLIKTRGAFCVVFDEKSRTVLEFKVFQPFPSFQAPAVIGFLESLTRV
jgi:hypothetical protein